QRRALRGHRDERRLDFGGRGFLELLFYVDRLSDDLCNGYLRPRRAGEESFGLHRDGHLGRRGHAEAHGALGRRLEHVRGVLDAALLFRRDCALRLFLASARRNPPFEWYFYLRLSDPLDDSERDESIRRPSGTRLWRGLRHRSRDCLTPGSRRG